MTRQELLAAYKEEVRDFAKEVLRFQDELDAEFFDSWAEHLTNLAEKLQDDLPQGLDEAAHLYSWEKQEHHIDFDGDEYFDYGPRYDAFKAGASWMAGQGVTVEGEIMINANYPYQEKVVAEIPGNPFEFGDKVIVQIRKKED